MNTANRLFPFALLTGLMVAPAALADHDDRWEDRRERQERREYREYREHRHNEHCYHGPGDMPAPQQGPGRYELRAMNVWVPGYRDEVWVPQECEYKRHRNRMRCTGGYYDTRWVDGHYEQRQQWVWVQAPPPPVYRAPVVYPAPPSRPGWDVQVGVHL